MSTKEREQKFVLAQIKQNKTQKKRGRLRSKVSGKFPRAGGAGNIPGKGGRMELGWNKAACPGLKLQSCFPGLGETLSLDEPRIGYLKSSNFKNPKLCLTCFSRN